jgi:ATP-binding cassette subfamily C (CFTR/MRP) protein 1
LTLLRFVELDKGSINVDGFDLSRIPHTVVRRQCFITIPQDPVLVSECSLRFTLDPSETYSDSQLVQALVDVRLWSHFSDFCETIRPRAEANSASQSNNLLDLAMTWYLPLTQSQLQLLALSRAILRTEPPRKLATAGIQSRPILLLDEATSAMDSETEMFFHELIHRKFTNQAYTVLWIAHGIDLLDDHGIRHSFDRVIRLNKGALQEL